MQISCSIHLEIAEKGVIWSTSQTLSSGLKNISGTKGVPD
jgi:hypothetical protein